MSYKLYHLLIVSGSFQDDFYQIPLLSSLSNLCFFTNPSFRTIHFLQAPHLKTRFRLIPLPALRAMALAVVGFVIPCSLSNFCFFSPPFPQVNLKDTLLSDSHKQFKGIHNEWMSSSQYKNTLLIMDLPLSL